jgi:signal transduction histidine kinase
MRTGKLIDALEQASRLRAEFASTMSHELRTPLNVILGLAEMARDPTFEVAERDALLVRLRQAGLRLLEMVDGTLEIGNLEAGRTEEIEVREIAVAALWNELERGCVDLVPSPGVDLRWQPDVPEGEIQTDPRKLLIVLRNLLGNAIKFTESGHVRVRLEGDQDAITLVVEDTGIGIRREDQDLVFEMFRQADGSETRRFEGSGLGLYIVRHVAQQLGGAVQLTSEPGRGSTVAVTLPRIPAPANADDLDDAELDDLHAA